MDSKITKAYAQALFLLAQERSVLDQIAGDMQGLKICLKESEELKSFIQNPIFTIEERSALLKSIFDKQIDPLTLNFLLFLNEKMRLNALAEIVEAFNVIYSNSKNIMDVVIRTARPIDPNQLQELVQKLAEHLKKDVHTELIVDEHLIGGFKIQTNNEVYDSSFTTQLENFRNSVVTAI